jgi:hypothetical protein
VLRVPVVRRNPSARGGRAPADAPETRRFAPGPPRRPRSRRSRLRKRSEARLRVTRAALVAKRLDAAKPCVCFSSRARALALSVSNSPEPTDSHRVDSVESTLDPTEDS